MNEPEDFISMKGTTIPRKISVEYISFSAHVDYSQNSEFIELVKAQHVVGPLHDWSHFLRIQKHYFLGSCSWRTDSHGTFACRHDVSLQRTGRGRQNTHPA